MKLNEVFTGWLSGDGIFTRLSRLPTPPAWNDAVQGSALDLLYHGNHSGAKTVSVLVDALTENDAVTDASKQAIAASIMAMYGDNWARLWDAVTADYNPISNYDMVETFEETGENNGTRNDSNTFQHGETITNNGKTSDTGTVGNSGSVTHGENIQNDNTALNGVFGFNSVDAVGSDNMTGSGTESHSGTDTTQGTETRNLNGTLENTQTHSGNDVTTGEGSTKENHNVNHTLKRSGNIGVTTSQQMLESEYELRKKSFFDQVFEDVDKILTIPIYN